MDPLTPRFGTVTIRDRGRLPHWTTDSATYFVTFRLADSLPTHAIAELNSVTASKLTPTERARQAFATLERYVDAGSGSCLLKHDSVAHVVSDTLFKEHGKRYRLLAWCVMPNHVHVCLRAISGHELSSIVQTWKSVSSHKINDLLQRSGTLWMREYYDRLVRSETELARVIQYIERNPVKAGLTDWKWLQVLSDK